MIVGVLMLMPVVQTILLSKVRNEKSFVVFRHVVARSWYLLVLYGEKLDDKTKTSFK